MNIYLVAILAILIGRYIIDVVVESLNIRCASPVLPGEFAGYFDARRYKKAQDYLKENTNFGLIKGAIFTALILIFILTGGFSLLDRFVRSLNFGPILSGLIFAGTVLLAGQILNIPFSAYRTFVIEEKYGFNRTKVKTFILDILKSCFLAALIGGIIFAIILWLFGRMGRAAWLYCWVVVMLFQLFLVFIAPGVILPLFNKFVPLEEGELRKAIEQYVQSVGFRIKEIFKMDASRRSSKANAALIGFGKFRRLALFDTLIARLSVKELVSVLAHEIGHYKKRHLLKEMAVSFATSGIMFFILSLFIENPGLFSAFKMEETSIYASIIFFGFFFAPLNMVFSVFSNALSRRNEYAADAYSVSTYKQPEAFIASLKKLSVNNLSHLTPHPWKVFLDYTHPPILKRIQAIREMVGG